MLGVEKFVHGVTALLVTLAFQLRPIRMLAVEEFVDRLPFSVTLCLSREG